MAKVGRPTFVVATYGTEKIKSSHRSYETAASAAKIHTYYGADSVKLTTRGGHEVKPPKTIQGAAKWNSVIRGLDV